MNATYPQELIRTLSSEEKEALLMELLREAIRTDGDAGPISIDDEDGTSLGILVIRASAKDQHPPRVTPEQETEFIRRTKEGRFLSEKEFLDWVKTDPLD